MRPQAWIVLAGVFGALAVTAGAFGAHGLEGRLSAEQLATFEVAARYQMYNALALGLVGLLAIRQRCGLLTASGWCFLAGALLFSGLLYVLVFSGIKWLGAIVPLGGLAMIAGWSLLAAAGWSQRE